MKFVIPSFNRETQLKGKTLKYLSKHNIPPEDIFIFVRLDDHACLHNYLMLKNDGYNVECLKDVKGIGKTHNAITGFFGDGEWICEIDDDLGDMINKEGQSIENFSDEIENMKKTMEEKGLNYGGFYSVPNPYFMANIKTQFTTDLRYMLGLIRVRRICKDVKLETNYAEDFENCILHFIRDGGILKNNYIAGKTNNYAKGGCNADGRDNETEKKDKEFLSNKYPQYCKLFQRKN